MNQFPMNQNALKAGRSLLLAAAAALMLAACGTQGDSKAAAVAPAASERLEISNLKTGLFDSKREQVTSSERHVKFKPNDVCPADGKNVPCMIFAFEFDYRNGTPGTPVECTTRLSAPGDFGPASYPLSKTAGHFYQTIYVTRDPGDKGIETLNLKCTYQGQEVLTTDFSVDYD